MCIIDDSPQDVDEIAEWRNYSRGMGWGALIASLVAVPVLAVLLWVY